MPRAELRDELGRLLRLLPVRSAAERNGSGPEVDLAGFRPFSFLSSLVERVGEIGAARHGSRRRVGAPGAARRRPP